MYRNHYLVLLTFVAGIYACNKVPAHPIFTSFRQPAGFPAPAYAFDTNPVTEAGFLLGKKLFYDPILSANNTISCGSCHIPTSAFTQHGHSVSHGILDRLGTRNSQPIMNLAWSTSFMWDGGIFNLDLQPLAPITSHVEMDNSLTGVLSKLRSSAVYPAMFEAAFGSNEITGTQFLKALSQFMVMCISSESKYDSVLRGQAVFNAGEAAGYTVYQQHCSACHTEPLFTDHSFRNNGIGISAVNDVGRYAITLQETDKYKFKTPSLRNLSFTPPYMHDGRFFSLEAVLDHYTSGVQHTPNLDPLLQQQPQLGIALSPGDKAALLSFLHTLNDRHFISDKRLLP